MADTFCEYDDHGELTRTVLNVNGSPGIELASTDRISQADKHFELDGAWWSTTVQRIYPDTGDARVVTTATTRARLTGFARPSQTS